MDLSLADAEPRVRTFSLPGRGGESRALEFGPQDRPIDVIFSHANGFNARTYRTILGPLADRLRILAVDQRGHGRSGLPSYERSAPASWDDVADDLLALIESLDAPPLVLAGHSMGGTISLLAAAEAPKRVKALALFDPVIMPRDLGRDPAAVSESPLVQGALRRRAMFPSRAAAVAAYTGRGAFKTWTDAMLADYVADGFRDRPDGEVELSCSPAWEASNFTSHAHDPWAALAHISAPIHVVRAEVGSTCRIEGHEAEFTASGKVTVETVPGTSHFLPMERPDLVAHLLLEAAG